MLKTLTRRSFGYAALLSVGAVASLITASGCSSSSSTYQKAAESALSGKSGALVALDPATGEVLALASAGDPTDASVEKSKALELHVPGSTFKTVTLAAALDAGVVTQDQVYNGPASLSVMGGAVTNAGDASYQRITAQQAYALSVNTVFSQIGLKLTFDQFQSAAQAFGFGSELAGSAHPVSVLAGENITVLQQAWMSIGQPLFIDKDPDNFVGPKVTPLHMAVLFGAVANGGTLYLPCGSDIQTSATKDKPVALTSAVATPETINYLQECMRLVVESPDGTGAQAAVSGLDVRGKTGTGESGRGYNDCWFCGYASSAKKTISFATLIEGTSSTEACEVAAQFLSSALL